ncbi:MAG TPA: hypothetical protein DDX92_02860 [Flavobacteriales bacterium]|jgi:membrane associated rhomboid family serine protease|nr:hypothetical protein [Flavobacteriales bacterium]
MSQYRTTGFSLLPPVVKNLLIINILLFIATETLASQFGYDLSYKLGLHWIGSDAFEPYQVITYMFMHGSFEHIFFNMFAVWMFGSAIENTWGAKKFLTYYILTGIGAAVLHYVIVYFQDIQPFLAFTDAFLADPSQDSLKAVFENVGDLSMYLRTETMLNLYNDAVPSLNKVIAGVGTQDDLEIAYNFMDVFRGYYLNLPNVVGASGSLFGILLAFGMLFPNVHLFLIFFPIPIKAKYFVAGYGLIELVSGLSNSPGDNVAHFAHLGGMIFGYFLIRFFGYGRTNFRQN